MLWIIIGVTLFIGFIVFNYFRSKNAPEVKKSSKILIVNKKNFSGITRRGLVLVDFWAAWCQPCKLMLPVLNEIAETESVDVKVAKVNVEYEKQLAAKFKIKNIPTCIIFKDGVEYKRFSGVKTKRFLLKEINS
ncbi:MAG: thioredoxin [Mariniphaga sp.]|nr:thioredoxin [Mariniphaga sp.]